MSNTVHVPHLGGIDVAYQTSGDLKSGKPVLVLVHSFMTSSGLYDAQFQSKAVTDAADLIAFDLLGHGKTRTDSEHFTYWDMAIMILQALEQLGVKEFYGLGTSQGGWIVIRAALLAPKQVKGAIIVGTSMDYESERTRKLGCWDIAPVGDALISGWSSKEATPQFELDDNYCGLNMNLGIGPESDLALRTKLIASMKEDYRGDDGRKRARMAAINLRDRDSLHGRLFDVVCPVLWMHGTSDQVYSVANAEEEIKLFVNAKDAKLVTVDGGFHFLSASNPAQVEPAIVDFLQKHT